MATTITRKSTTQFFNNEVKEYATYVVHTRALPNIMDGLRIGARKILYASIKNKKLNPANFDKRSKIKMVHLIGETMNMEFNHGDVSLKNTIEQLASKHYNKQSPLYVIGQIGTLRDPKINTAARYLKVISTKYLQLYTDHKELWDYSIEDGNKVQPNFFLPLIPISLLYRTNAPGFGFSYRSFSYDIDDLINAVLSVLINDSCTGLNHVEIKPVIDGIKQSNIIYNSNINNYYNVGEYVLTAKNQILITDLPYTQYFDKYNSYLFDLKEKGIILDYQNETNKGNIAFRITFPIGRMEQLIKTKLKFFKLLRLYQKVPDDKLNLIDTNRKSIVYFTNRNELVEAFVKRRLNFYDDFKQLKIKDLKSEIRELETKLKFLQLIIDEKVIINKRTKSNIVEQFKQHGLIKRDVLENLKLSISRLTKDEMDKTQEKLDGLYDLLKYYQETSIRELYIRDLIDFKQKFGENKITKIN